MVVDRDSTATGPPSEGQPTKRPGRRRLAIAGAIALAALAVVGVGAYGLFGGFDRNQSQRISGDGTKVVRVALVDALVGFDVTPDTLIVDSDTTLVLEVVNEGDEPHDLAVDGGPHTSLLDPGESERLELGRIGEDIEPYCTIPGHRPSGMEMDVETRAS